MPRHRFHTLLPVILTLLAGGCGSSNDNTAPTIPTPPTFTDTFSGTLNPNGGATHTFVTQVSGSVSATLTTVSPDSTVVIGFSLGTWNGVYCQVVLANDRALQGAVILGNVGSAGTLCLRVYDIGTLTEATSYEVQVVHP